MEEEYRGIDVFLILRVLGILLVIGVFAGIVRYASRLDQHEAVLPVDHYTGIGIMDAQHTIRLSNALPEDSYTLFYENDEVPVADYEAICTLRPGETYDDLIVQNAAPATADGIGVYDSTGIRIGSFHFISSFSPETGKKLYSFGVLSDVHIGYETSEDDLKTALTYLTQTEKVSFVSITGDLTAACADDQLDVYKSIVDEYAGTTPVYAVTGNHDTEQYRGSNISDSIHRYTGQPMYYSMTLGEDVFIFLGNYNGYDTGRLFTREQLQWLYETLEENRNRRCFVFEHIRPDDTSGNPHDLQSVDIWGGVEKDVFESLLRHYPNVTMFHGHSHTALALQADVDHANYDESIGFRSVHVPALFGTRELDQYGYRCDDIGACEGYVVDVYQNGIVIRGLDFNSRKHLPIATYFLDTTVQMVTAGQFEDERMTVNCDVILPIWNYRTVVDSVDGSSIFNEDFSTTENIPVENGYVYYAHQYWNCPYSGEVIYYDADGEWIGSSMLWGQEAYSGPVHMEMPEEAAFFRIKQWTRNDEEHHTKDIFVSRRASS